MKFIHTLICALILTSFITFVISKNLKEEKKQVQVVQDQTGGFGSNIGVVIRKTPTVIVDNVMTNPLVSQPQAMTHFSNSNTSSYPNIGNMGKSPEIVNPTILFHSKTKTTLVKSTPAHLGYKNEKTSYTAFNKQTGNLETHDTIEKKPIYGQIESIKDATFTNTRPLDLQFNRYRKEKERVQNNAEFSFGRSNKQVIGDEGEYNNSSAIY